MYDGRKPVFTLSENERERGRGGENDLPRIW